MRDVVDDSLECTGYVRQTSLELALLLVGRSILAAAMLMTVTACRHDDDLFGPSRVARATAVAAEGQSEVPTGEALFAELDRVAPSSAGFFFDGADRLVVNVADPADAAVSIQR